MLISGFGRTSPGSLGFCSPEIASDKGNALGTQGVMSLNIKDVGLGNIFLIMG